MKIIQPSFEILSYTNDLTLLIEKAARVCYKSEDRIGAGSDTKIIEHLKGMHHESVLEHGSISVRIICDRGVSHELVRHRLVSYSQESTRYCAYNKGKFDSEITVIEPPFFSEGSTCRRWWQIACLHAERSYMLMIDGGATAQEARSVLPNSLKTELVMTANPREWRHILTMRTSNAAHPQMRQIMSQVLNKFRVLWPVLFNDIGEVLK